MHLGITFIVLLIIGIAFLIKDGNSIVGFSFLTVGILGSIINIGIWGEEYHSYNELAKTEILYRPYFELVKKENLPVSEAIAKYQTLFDKVSEYNEEVKRQQIANKDAFSDSYFNDKVGNLKLIE
tara:strand:- start:2325 stop:2699 length:375 start_codon:yes stop_codon:yes gene_type:complete